MEPADIQIVLIVVNMCLTVMMPIVSSLVYFVKHLKSSSCCGKGGIIMRKDSKEDIV